MSNYEPTTAQLFWIMAIQFIVFLGPALVALVLILRWERRDRQGLVGVAPPVIRVRRERSRKRRHAA